MEYTHALARLRTHIAYTELAAPHKITHIRRTPSPRPACTISARYTRATPLCNVSRFRRASRSAVAPPLALAFWLWSVCPVYLHAFLRTFFRFVFPHFAWVVCCWIFLPLNLLLRFISPAKRTPQRAALTHDGISDTIRSHSRKSTNRITCLARMREPIKKTKRAQ